MTGAFRCTNAHSRRQFDGNMLEGLIDSNMLQKFDFLT